MLSFRFVRSGTTFPIVYVQMCPACSWACCSLHPHDSLSSWRCAGATPARNNEQAPTGKRHVRDTRSPDESDRQPDQNPRCRHHRRRAGVLRLLPDRLRARLPDRAVEAHLRPVGNRADEFRHRRHHRRLCLGLARRPHRPPHGLHRHRAEFLDRHRPALFHARQWLDLSRRHALLCRHRRRRALLRGPAAGAGIHALLQARLGRRHRDLRHPARRRPRRRAGAFMGSDQWRLLFAIGVLPALLVLLVRLWVPESPRWLCRQGRYEEARKSLAWALQMEPSALPLPTAADAGPIIKTQLVRSVQISAQPAGVLARQCRRADRRLRHHAVGAVAVRAAVEGDAAGSRQDDDPAHRVRLHRPPLLLLFLGADGAAHRGRPAWASAPAS